MLAARIAAELVKTYGEPASILLIPEGDDPPKIFLNGEKVYDGLDDVLKFSQTRIVDMIKPKLQAALQAARAAAA